MFRSSFRDLSPILDLPLSSQNTRYFSKGLCLLKITVIINRVNWFWENFSQTIIIESLQETEGWGPEGLDRSKEWVDFLFILLSDVVHEGPKGWSDRLVFHLDYLLICPFKDPTLFLFGSGVRPTLIFLAVFQVRVPEGWTPYGRGRKESKKGDDRREWVELRVHWDPNPDSERRTSTF